MKKKRQSLKDGLIAHYEFDYHHIGKIDRVVIWNRILTKKERMDLYWLGFPPLERFIKRYFLYPTRLIYVWYFAKRVGRFLKRIW